MPLPKEDFAGRTPARAKVTLPPTAQTWEDALHIQGFSPTIVNELNAIWRGSGADASKATPLALRYIRGTPWYAQNFPGISEGIRAGLFNDERGYQQYKTQVGQTYKQYYNRPPTAAEIGNYVRQGFTPERVARQFESSAIRGSGAIPDPLKGLFSPAELKAYANQAAGLPSVLGQRVTLEANLATGLGNLYQSFRGYPVTRAELDQLLKNGTTPEQVAQQFQTITNMASTNPAIAALFTPQEVKQAALSAAGGISPQGALIQKQMDLAAQLNPIYHQYTGQGVSRADIAQSYKTGETPEAVRGRLAGAAYVQANGQDIQQTLGAFGGGQLSPEQLQAAGQQAVGYDTPLGMKLQTAYQKAQTRMQAAFQGTLARATLNLAGGRLTGPRRPPDVGA